MYSIHLSSTCIDHLHIMCLLISQYCGCHGYHSGDWIECVVMFWIIMLALKLQDNADGRRFLPVTCHSVFRLIQQQTANHYFYPSWLTTWASLYLSRNVAGMSQHRVRGNFLGLNKPNKNQTSGDSHEFSFSAAHEKYDIRNAVL